MKVILDMCIPSETRIFNKERLVLLTVLSSHRKCHVWKRQQNNNKKRLFSPVLYYFFFTIQKISLFLMRLPAKSYQLYKRRHQISALVPSHRIFSVLRAIFLAWINTQTGTFLNKEKHSHLPELTLVMSISSSSMCSCHWQTQNLANPQAFLNCT